MKNMDNGILKVLDGGWMVYHDRKYATRFIKDYRNDDGSFTIDWDKNDPNWKFLNGLTSKEIQVIIEQVIKEDNITDD